MEAAHKQKKATLEPTLVEGEKFYKISNSDTMRPFFMSIVSASNHWLFISSNGGLTAGRKNAEFALFPYYTDDKITESSHNTGSKSIFRVKKNEEIYIWEPFSEYHKGKFHTQRNLYKNLLGNKIIFEEVNLDLELSYTYEWCSSNLFGFVRKSKLENNGTNKIEVNVLDGVQNIMPYGVASDLQNAASNLVDAYKRTELDPDSGMGLFALSAIIIDKAEPSEALKANTVWSYGVENPTYLLSSLQLDTFRNTGHINQETDVKAEKGAYFIHSTISINANDSKEWGLVANVNQSHSQIATLRHEIIFNTKLKQQLIDDVALGNENLRKLLAASDGFQLSSDHYRDARHLSNTLFNIMRGGIFDDNYHIEKSDFTNYLEKANNISYRKLEAQLNLLPETFTLEYLKKIADSSTDLNFQRLCLEYMPIKFSRRHGDPSRPWNKFSINTRSEADGSKILYYEGNWRDIFQNWEALAYSFPRFIESMIHKFLNATTFDGYNPYRITKDGFDWEVSKPDDPWSYIGYWGDHQIIYLLKFLEFIENHQPESLSQLFDKDVFVYANVPYKIKAFEDLINNPKDTIEFDFEADKAIREKRDALGADGALLTTEIGQIYNVNFIEKILATVLAKLSNFIPEGGIWMNTQRPEWNDANNALVGHGVSMVTLYYLRRFLNFFKTILPSKGANGVKISVELADFYKTIRQAFENQEKGLAHKVNDKDRKLFLNTVGQAASDFRTHIYNNSFWGKKRTVSFNGIRSFIESSLKVIDHSIKHNKRSDHLYHAYNLMTVKNNSAISIDNLNEMLEGQVAVLSSGYLSSKDALQILDALKQSALFREDQYSYLLYPNKALPGFLEKNLIQEHQIQKSELLTTLIKEGNRTIIEKDLNKVFHFNGDFKNAKDVEQALDNLKDSKYASLVNADRDIVLNLFEDTFNHKAFTGRSGTFYGYEGLGSIYWHMVSKLQLAVQECCLKAIKQKDPDTVIGKLLEHYYEINEGIGVHKSPTLYGAFPSDPYSHTPLGKGAQQPGMTGQVKEDIISRFGELGVFVIKGQLYFNPCLLRKDEFLKTSKKFTYYTVTNKKQEIPIQEGSLCFTYCQIPIIYSMSTNNKISVTYTDGTQKTIPHLTLDTEATTQIFNRNNTVSKIQVMIDKYLLK